MSSWGCNFEVATVQRQELSNSTVIFLFPFSSLPPYPCPLTLEQRVGQGMEKGRRKESWLSCCQPSSRSISISILERLDSQGKDWKKGDYIRDSHYELDLEREMSCCGCRGLNPLSLWVLGPNTNWERRNELESWRIDAVLLPNQLPIRFPFPSPFQVFFLALWSRVIESEREERQDKTWERKKGRGTKRCKKIENNLMLQQQELRFDFIFVLNSLSFLRPNSNL